MSEETLKELIITTISGEIHLGENLKKQMIGYINNLQQQLFKQRETMSYLKKALKETKKNSPINEFDSILKVN